MTYPAGDPGGMRVVAAGLRGQAEALGALSLRLDGRVGPPNWKSSRGQTSVRLSDASVGLLRGVRVAIVVAVHQGSRE